MRFVETLHTQHHNATTTTRRASPESTLPALLPAALAFRALPAYSLFRTLSRPLGLLPFVNPLWGQVHVAVLLILLRKLQTGYTNHGGSNSGGGGRNSGGNSGTTTHGGRNRSSGDGESSSSLSSSSSSGPSIYLVTKNRKLDGLKWPLKAGDNLSFWMPGRGPSFTTTIVT